MLGGRSDQFLNLGSFAERVLVFEDALVKIPTTLPLEEAALLGCGVATGVGAVLNTAKVKSGDSVAVIGCGGVGLSVIQGARIAGAFPIVAVDVVKEKLDLARRLGATDVIDGSSDDPVEQVMRITDGVGVDHAFEALGSKTTIEAAFQMLAWGGRATMVGLPPDSTVLAVPAIELFHEKALTGSKMGSTVFRRDMPRLVHLYERGELQLDPMVTRRLTIDQINDGFDDMRQGLSARSLVVFEG